MAVDGKRKRKRKHENASNDAVEVVPKKIQRKDADEFQKNRNDGEDQEEMLCAQEEEDVQDGSTSHDSGYEEKQMKFSTDFKMLDFRNKLRGTNFITELRHFLYLCEVRPKIVAKYIEKRGKPLELAEALERVDKSNILHNAYLCEALQRVVMEIITNQPNHSESAMHACRYFLKAHSNIVDLLLNSAQLKHRRVALKLLAAIVCVDVQLGRQLLSSFDILSNVKTIENLLSHSQHEMHEEDSVRKCFVHFVLAYLIEGNSLLVRNILDRSALIRALISGLCFDDHVTVCVVLNSLRKYVLQNSEISKTKKIHVFDLESCKKIARLYDWKGPKGFIAQFKTKKESQSPEFAVDAKELEAVVTATHEFLKVLMTSRKHGIAFDAITHYRQKHNAVHGKLIGSLYKPWCDARKTELIVKILMSCPEIGRTTIRHFAGVVNPIRTREKVEAARFLAKLIDTLQPALLKPAFEKMTLTDFGNWIKDVCLPTESLVFLTQTNWLRHQQNDHRLAASELLLSMFRQYANYMEALRKRQQTQSTGSSQLRRFKFDILNHLLVNFPTVDKILHSLFMTITDMKPQVSESVEEVLSHLDVTLDLLLIICKQNRSFVNQTSKILDFLNMLRPLYAENEEVDDDDDDDDVDENMVEDGDKDKSNERKSVVKTEEGEEEQEIDITKSKKNIKSAKVNSVGKIKLELKAIKTILLLHPKALEPHAPLFRNVLKSFLKAFVYDSDEVRQEAGVLLRNIFKNTGLFDTCELEIDIWLEALRFFDAETLDVVTQVFIEVFQVTTADVEMPESGDTKSNIENLNKLFENIESGLSVQGYVENFEISKLMLLIFKGVEIEDPLKQYLETVCLLMFHFYSKPEYILKVYEMEFDVQSDYMKHWLNTAAVGEKANDLLKSNSIAKNVPFALKLQKAILSDAAASGVQAFEKVFSPSNAKECFETEVASKSVKLSAILENPRLLALYIQQILFIVSRLVEHKKLSQAQAENAAGFIINLLELMQKLQTALEASGDATDYGYGSETSTEDEGNNQLTFLSLMVKYIYGARFNHVRSDMLFSIDSNAHSNYLLFLHLITQHCSQLPEFLSHTKTFRLKIVKAVAITMSNVAAVKQQSVGLAPAIKLVEAFELDAENCMEILEILCTNLKYSDFFNKDNDQWQRTFFYDLLLSILKRLCVLQQYDGEKCSSILKRLTKFYCQFLSKLSNDLNLEQFEVVLHDFLNIAHQYIVQLDVKLFQSFFSERKLSKASIKLAMLLFERDPKLNAVFVEQIAESINKKELIYPLLKVAIKKDMSLSQATWSSIYQEYRSGFMKTIEKPQKAAIIYKENVECSKALIEHCMPPTECLDFCKKSFKFNDSTELYQVQLMHTIYEKAFQSAELKEDQRPKIFSNFIDIQIQMLLTDLKRQTLTLEKIQLFAYLLYDWFKHRDSLKAECSFEKILSSQNWLNFCRQSLKIGMQQQQQSQDEEQQQNEASNVDNFNSLLLKTLSFLCDKLYVDYYGSEGGGDTNAEEPKEPARLIEMICTHSRFYEIVLVPRSVPVKTQVLNLLWTLAKKSPQEALAFIEIPAILGSYQAKLSDADRYALALLQMYESQDAGTLQKYRPFIWGESAIAFYALRSADSDERARLMQQETSIAQVMSLIDKQCCEYTIDNFPIWRKLNAIKQVPECRFLDSAALKGLQCLGNNKLEQQIEISWLALEHERKDLNLSIDDLRMCPTRSNIHEECYDPAFFIPLMNMCFAPESYTHAARPVQNGLLSMCFAALSSQDKDMRQAAGCAQMRYRAHFEQSKFYEKPLWIQAYENIQAGLSDLCDSWSQKHKKASKQYVPTPRVPYIPTLFIAQTFNLTTDPTHLLYKQLTMYLRLKSVFNFHCVPEFNVLFYSMEVEHHSFRQFIIQIIKNGIKCSSDLFLLVSTNTFKVLLGFYGSPMANLETNLLILSVLSVCAKIPASAKIMVEHVGIISWLRTTISSVEFHQFDVIEGIISTTSNLFYAITAAKSEFHNYSFLCLELHHLLLSLLPHLSARISINNFARLLNILQKTATIIAQSPAATAQIYKAMSSEQLERLIGCAQIHFGVDNLRHIENLKSMGGAGALAHRLYCTQLADDGRLDSSAILALSSLRGYTLNWWEECGKPIKAQ